MENETLLKEILNAFNLYSQKMDEKLNELREEMKTGFADVNKRLDRLTNRLDGTQADLMETKETVHFIHSKIVQHDKMLHKLSHQQQ